MTSNSPPSLPPPAVDAALPYERQPGEPSRAFALFACYRDLGGRRTLRSASRRHHAAADSAARLRQAQEWSRLWKWVERCDAWDAHVDRESRLATVEAVREMNRRHVLISREGVARAWQAMRRLHPDMSVAEIARMIDLFTRLERSSLGQPTEHVRQEVSGDVGHRHTIAVVERIVTTREDARASGRSMAAGPICEPLLELPDEPPPPAARLESA